MFKSNVVLYIIGGKKTIGLVVYNQSGRKEGVLEKTSVIRLSCTIGPVDAGIVPLLAKIYEERTGIKIMFEAAGTGATL